MDSKNNQLNDFLSSMVDEAAERWTPVEYPDVSEREYKIRVESILRNALGMDSSNKTSTNNMDPILGKETVIWNPDHMYWDSVHNVIYVNARELFLMTPSHPAEWWVKDFILHNPITERSRLFEVEKNATPEFTRCFSAPTQNDSRGLLLYMWWDSNQYARKVEDAVLYKAKVK